MAGYNCSSIHQDAIAIVWQHTIWYNGTMVQWYATPWYVHMYHGTIGTYTYTNITLPGTTLSQKRQHDLKYKHAAETTQLARGSCQHEDMY
jgi:hypothetical protein